MRETGEALRVLGKSYSTGEHAGVRWLSGVGVLKSPKLGSATYAIPFLLSCHIVKQPEAFTQSPTNNTSWF